MKTPNADRVIAVMKAIAEEQHNVRITVEVSSRKERDHILEQKIA